MNVAQLIKSSFREAAGALAMGTSAATLERARRRVFVKALAVQLQRQFAEEDLRVFSEFGRGNLRDFGTEALLYDISVCRVASGSTAMRQSEEFSFVREAIWQIEVDFSRSWRGAIDAINRLNCGSASMKLLVAAEVGSRNESLLKTLAEPFAAGTGAQYVALIPHPVDWGETELRPRVWRLDDGNWVEQYAGSSG